VGDNFLKGMRSENRQFCTDTKAMKKNIIVLAVLLVTHGCLNTHQRLGMLGEESNIAADSGTIWFESFVEAIDHAENFKEVQKVLDQGKAQDYLACGVELEDDEYPRRYTMRQSRVTCKSYKS
jgi:hypothetical protein